MIIGRISNIIIQPYSTRSHTALIAGLAAQKFGRPVRLSLTCGEDMMFAGAKHEVIVRYQVSFDKSGKIITAKFKAFANAGCSSDLSTVWIQVSRFSVVVLHITKYNSINTK